jgi:hypothetical protein
MNKKWFVEGSAYDKFEGTVLAFAFRDSGKL